MMGFFIEPYEDELCYSIFSRYYIRSGYLSFASVAEDLFKHSKCKPNIEFCNMLSDDVLGHIGSLYDIITKHTMFNYYSAFLSSERKQEVKRMALDMNIKSLTNALPLPKCRYKRYLRYCPMCVDEDRTKYGETYWHRSHQLYGINVCYKHSCKLIDASVPITSSASPSLVTAEECITNIGNIITANDIETKIAEYAYKVLTSYSDSYSAIGDYLQYRIQNTKYISSRGASRNIRLLTSDFNEYYKDIDLLGFKEDWQIEKVFNNQRFNSYENCLLGMFLGISADELVERYIGKTDNTIEIFDSRIKELKEQGFNYREIASKMGISYDYCKCIGNNRLGKYHYYSAVKKEDKRKKDWISLDIETLPILKELIKEMTNIGNSRPYKVSIGRVERLLGLKEGQLLKLSKCVDYVRQHIISQEEHYARIIAWTIKQIKKDNKEINISNIKRISNLRNQYIKDSVPYLAKYLDDISLKIIEDICKSC